MNRFLLLAVVGYIAVAAASVLGLIAARNGVLRSLGNVSGQQAWEDWRSAVESQGDEPTVTRSVPRSSEPPALVLLRDHFAACLAGVLLMSTPLYWSLVLFVRGVLSGPTIPDGGHESNGQGRGPHE